MSDFDAFHRGGLFEWREKQKTLPNNLNREVMNFDEFLAPETSVGFVNELDMKYSYVPRFFFYISRQSFGVNDLNTIRQKTRSFEEALGNMSK